jgi:branched-chain amino acid transport system permease protein
VIGNVITGLAGALYAHTFQFISPVSAGFQKSVEILLAVVIGGMFSIWGSLVGAAILVLIPELLRFLPHLLTGPLDTLVAHGIFTHRISHLFMNFLQSSMLIFSVLVLVIVNKIPNGVSSLGYLLKKPLKKGD